MVYKKANFANALLKRNINPSHQRIKVLEYLSVHKNHPTVDDIFIDLKKEMPTLSKSTVYNTIKVFVNEGLVQELNIEDNEIRYDLNILLHGHFKCKNCGMIYDFDIDVKAINNFNGLDEFKIDSQSVYFKGICRECIQK